MSLLRVLQALDEAGDEAEKAAQERPGAAEVEATSGRGGEGGGPHGARGPAPVSRDQAEDQDQF